MNSHASRKRTTGTNHVDERIAQLITENERLTAEIKQNNQIIHSLLENSDKLRRAEMRRMRDEGCTFKEIASCFKISAGRVRQIIESEKWAEQVKHLKRESVPGSLESLDLAVRTRNALRMNGIQTVDELLDALDVGDGYLLSFRNFGSKALREVKDRLTATGYQWGEKA